MKKCLRCSKDHDGSFGSGKYCNRGCANARSHSKETKAKMSFSSKTSEKSLKQHESMRKEKVTKTCPQCSSDFKTHVSESFKTYCSKQCYLDDSEQKHRISAPGGYRKGSGRGKSGWYSSKIAGDVFLDSSWELAYAKHLDKNNIEWKRNTIRFDYIRPNGKQSYYIPDFYLVKEDKYIEIKGFKTELDDYKWKSVDNLTVLFKKELKELEII